MHPNRPVAMPFLFTDLDAVVTAAPGTGSTSLEMACRTAEGSTDLARSLALDPGEVDPKHVTWQQLRTTRDLSEVEHVVTTTRDPFDFHYADWYRTRTRWASETNDPSSWVHRVAGAIESIERACRLSFPQWIDDELATAVEVGQQRRVNRAHVDEASLILRMEQMRHDLAIGLPGLARRLGRIPFVNRTDRARDLREVYDRRSADLVAAAYRDDIDRFGYVRP